MPQSRPTAQQAIEVLKIHQLRKENVVIFDEIKHLRSEVTSRQNELNDTLEQVANLKSQLDGISKQEHCREKDSVTLQTALDSVKLDLSRLQQAQDTARTDSIEKWKAQQAFCEEIDAAHVKLHEELTQLRKQLDESGDKNADILEDMNDDLDAKADQKSMMELEDRVDQLIQDLGSRRACCHGVSRVTDTAEQLAAQTSGKALSAYMFRC